MKHPASTPAEIQSVIRSMRKSRRLSQAAVGKLIGVSQNRIARIEAYPSRIKFEQVSRLVAALGGRIVVEVSDEHFPVGGSSEPQAEW